MKRIIIPASLALAVSGCSYTHPSVIAPMALGPQEHAVAVVRGRSSAEYFFGLNVGGEDGLAEAIEDAKLKSGIKADSMANVFVDTTLFCFPGCYFPIYRSVTTSIFGTLISYDLPTDPNVKPDRSKSNGVM